LKSLRAVVDPSGLLEVEDNMGDGWDTVTQFCRLV